MAISLTSLASGTDEADATSYTTASIAPAAGRVWVAFVETGSTTINADPPDASLSGCSLTWTEVGQVIFSNDAGATRRKVQMFKGVGASPTTGVVTISYGATAGSCARAILELTGADTTTPIVVGSVVTALSNLTSNTSGTVTLNAAASANNRPICAFGRNANEATTPRTNWTELNDLSHANPVCSLETQWRSDTFETTASATWTTAGKYGVIAAEIKAASSAVADYWVVHN